MTIFLKCILVDGIPLSSCRLGTPMNSLLGGYNPQLMLLMCRHERLLLIQGSLVELFMSLIMMPQKGRKLTLSTMVITIRVILECMAQRGNRMMFLMMTMPSGLNLAKQTVLKCKQ